MIKNKKLRQSMIIAEAGVNHNGDILLAKKLVDLAKDCGADAVKFQTFRAEALVTRAAPQAAYQKRLARDLSQLEMLKKLELSFQEFRELSAYCARRKIIFLSTPFDSESARFLFQLGVPLFKISSGDLNNIPFLVEVARYRRPIILSTGMATLAEVRDSVLAIGRAGNRQLTLLHCTTDYPAAYRDVNLRAMATLREAFKLPVGLSDHTPGIEVSVAAAALGAEVIEKHFTLDKGMSGPDHQASLSPDELADLVKAVRNVEAALGDGCKAPRPCERAVSKVARKSLVAASDILPGMKVTPEMVTIKRPGTGMLPSLIDQVIGSRAVKRVDRDALLRWTDFDRGRKRK